MKAMKRPAGLTLLVIATVVLAACGGSSSSSSSSDLPDLDLPSSTAGKQPAAQSGTKTPSNPPVAPAALPPPKTMEEAIERAKRMADPGTGTTAPSPTLAPTDEAKPAAPPSTTPADPAKPKVSFSATNGTARQFSQRSLSEGRYFDTIVAEVEGFRATPYFDNKGIAIGFGYNVSFQKREMNRKAGIEVLKSEDDAKTLEGLSEDFKRTTLPTIKVTPEQGMAMSNFLKPKYENPMREWILGFDRLLPHQQAVLIYHAYKTGGSGAKTFKGLKRAIADMQANPTPDLVKAAGAHFEYKYTLGKEVRTDTRSGIYMQALWNDPAEYAKLISGKGSTFAASLPVMQGSGKTTVSDADIPDPLGDAKLEMELTGKRIKIKSYGFCDNACVSDKGRPSGGMLMGY